MSLEDMMMRQQDNAGRLNHGQTLYINNLNDHVKKDGTQHLV